MIDDPRIGEFIDKFDPALAADVRLARVKMRQIVDSGFELVFDKYNALVFGFSPTEKSIVADLRPPAESVRELGSVISDRMVCSPSKSQIPNPKSELPRGSPPGCAEKLAYPPKT